MTFPAIIPRIPLDLQSRQGICPGRAYFALHPGITFAWQTAGRNKTSFETRAELDAEDAADLTLASDVKILLRTVAVVVRGRGIEVGQRFFCEKSGPAPEPRHR